ncbi:hypothetical protein GOBAR_AA37322 [Gossypium barbadense]|uniref:Uncharacterized protein n=1 Tax=Gossypium barbadense TaxID=3634 RepID=A0A2P5VX23_GOSBA|nr:hypothetical protein GOBAR_AA37322 [Gossypium barbadense]
MGLKQAKQLEAGHVYIEKIRDAMKDNTQRARLMNVELYSRNLETFRVTEYISRRSGIPPRSYGVDLRNRRVKGRPTITRIRNNMDVREQVDPKRCTICKTVGHNRSKCPHGNVYTGQSSPSERN